jgi:hypothetical protein
VLLQTERRYEAALDIFEIGLTATARAVLAGKFKRNRFGGSDQAERARDRMEVSLRECAPWLFAKALDGNPPTEKSIPGLVLTTILGRVGATPRKDCLILVRSARGAPALDVLETGTPRRLAEIFWKRPTELAPPPAETARPVKNAAKRGPRR